MKYEPTEVDLLWMAGVLEMIHEGGLIVFPSSGLIYKVSHQKRTLTLQNVDRLKDTVCATLHLMTTAVAARFSYEVKEATQ